MRCNSNAGLRLYGAILSVFLSLVILTFCAPAADAAAGPETYNDGHITWCYYYDYVNREATIWGVASFMDTNNHTWSWNNLDSVELAIPSTIKLDDGTNVPVTGVTYSDAFWYYSFKKKTNLTKLRLPSTLKTISDAAFQGCSGLTSVEFAGTAPLTSIGAGAFSGCSSLNQFDFQPALKTIAATAFSETAITSVHLEGTSVATISNSAFGSGVTFLRLPETIQSIGTGAFNTAAPVNVVYDGSEEEWANVSVGAQNRFAQPIRFMKESPVVKPTVTSTTSYTTTPTNAVVKAVFTASEAGQWTRSGIRLYNASGTQIASKEETHNYNMSQLSVWYDVNKELGKTLSPNTTYSFEIYTYFNGEFQTAGTKTFKTDFKTELTWINTIEEVTNDSFTFSLKGQANTTGTFSEYSYVLKDAQTGKQLVNFVNNSDDHLFVTDASWFKLVSWNTAKWGYLAQGHTYLYQASYVFNGTRYYSDWYSVTTPDTWTPWMDGASMEKLSNDKVSFWFIAKDGDKVQDVKCYVYNDVDGLDAKVEVNYSLETNEFVHWMWYEDNLWNRPSWDYHGKGTFDIDDIGGRRDCYYYMQFVITDRSGNVTVDSTQAWYERDPAYGQRIYAHDNYPVTTKANATLTDASHLQLDLEGGDSIGVSGFRIAVYPQGSSRDSAYWTEVNDVTYLESRQINGAYHSIYTASTVIDLNATGLDGEQQLCVDVYTVQDLGEYQSLEPLTTIVSFDREPPRIMNTTAHVDGSGVLWLTADVEDASEIVNTGIRVWAPDDENYGFFGAALENGRMETDLPWEQIANGSNSKLLYVQAQVTDVYDNIGLGMPVLVQYGISPVLRLPDELRTIETEAFRNTSVYAVHIPSGCTSIGSGAFAGCSSLCYVFIPTSVTYIADDAFSGCSATIVSPIGSAAQEFAQTHNIAWAGEYK